MADATTKLVIEAQTKGLAEATRSASKLEDSLANVSKSAAASGRKMRDAIKEMSGELRRAQRDNDVLAAGFKSQSTALGKLEEQYKAVTKQITAMRQEAGRAVEQQRQIGGHGGGGGGPIIGGGGGGLLPPPPPPLIGANSPSGPFAGGMAPIPGLVGVDRSNVPFASGMAPIPGLTGPGPKIRTGSGAFVQGLLQGILPEAFIQRGPGAFAQAGGALAGRAVRGVAGAGAELLSSPLSGSQAAVSALSRIPFGGALAGGLQMSLQAAGAEAQAQRSLSTLLPFVRGAGGPGALASINGLRGNLGALGLQMGGYSATESAGMVGQMAAAGGGYASRLSPAAIREAFGAQAGLGIDVGTSGVLARGDQLGGTTGRGSSTLAKSIADAVSLGLEGSEIVKYVQTIAGSVESFAQTGIKVDPTSRGGLGRLLEASGGYSAPRAAALAGGVSGAMDQMADGGPQSANQFLVLQAAGFDPTDPDSFYKAQERLDNASPGDRAKIYAQARGQALKGFRGLSKYSRAAAYRNFARDTGQNLRIGEAVRDSSTTLSSDQIQAALQPPDAAAATAMTAGAAQSNTTDAARTLGQMSNLDSQTGQKFLPGMIQMDAQARKTLNSLSTAGSKFVDLAAKIQSFGADLIQLGGNAVGISSPATPQ